MANGLEMLMKTFGINPEEIKGSVEGFRQLVLRLAVGVERVEAQNRAIMAHFNIEAQDDDNRHDGHSLRVGILGQQGNSIGDSGKSETSVTGGVNRSSNG